MISQLIHPTELSCRQNRARMRSKNICWNLVKKMIGMKGKNMWWHRTFYCMAVLLHVLLLPTVCLEFFEDDVRKHTVKGNGANMHIAGRDISGKHISNGDEGLDGQAHDQLSHRQLLFQGFTLSALENSLMNFKPSILQRQSYLLLSADFQRLFSTDKCQTPLLTLFSHLRSLTLSFFHFLCSNLGSSIPSMNLEKFSIPSLFRQFSTSEVLEDSPNSLTTFVLTAPPPMSHPSAESPTILLEPFLPFSALDLRIEVDRSASYGSKSFPPRSPTYPVDAGLGFHHIPFSKLSMSPLPTSIPWNSSSTMIPTLASSSLPSFPKKSKYRIFTPPFLIKGFTSLNQNISTHPQSFLMPYVHRMLSFLLVADMPFFKPSSINSSQQSLSLARLSLERQPLLREKSGNIKFSRSTLCDVPSVVSPLQAILPSVPPSYQTSLFSSYDSRVLPPMPQGIPLGAMEKHSQHSQSPLALGSGSPQTHKRHHHMTLASPSPSPSPSVTGIPYMPATTPACRMRHHTCMCTITSSLAPFIQRLSPLSAAAHISCKRHRHRCLCSPIPGPFHSGQGSSAMPSTSRPPHRRHHRRHPSRPSVAPVNQESSPLLAPTPSMQGLSPLSATFPAPRDMQRHMHPAIPIPSSAPVQSLSPMSTSASSPSVQGLPPKLVSAPSPHSLQHRHPRTPVQASAGYAPIPAAAPWLQHIPPAAKSSITLPSPPPNPGCTGAPCSDPYTETPFGSPCGCVLPIQIRLKLGVPLYALFPFISVLAEELASSTPSAQNQVRIMGANTDIQDQEKSVVDVNFVPLGETFDNLTALLISQKFWNHEVHINETLFGNYTVIYVHYPGLPMSPYPAEPLEANGGKSKQPLGVRIKKRHIRIGAGAIVLIALSSAIAVAIFVGAVWFMLLKYSFYSRHPTVVEPAQTFYTTKESELERATDKFNPENIVGEGGFGRVYRGILDDGAEVAVKVLARDDLQGGNEFFAEVEMLSRLHHRNLVQLIGICAEKHCHCLVYELISNGSVESHLHGVDRDTAPLDWDARMKIALGAARGLAYLHEDSSPRVIHRDFKASNILLEADFTSKISDFGLAKVAPEKGSEHISTRVMGTFGYVAPEYAMTGHLLVKSDVYSYGVVLLELLTGRKPVDMSQPPGQENLVTWARPLLTSKEGLRMLIDSALDINNVPFNNLARVAAIASMCVQPEVSHRPFMGEVVQALKLVYNDSDDSNGIGSGNSQGSGQSPSCDSGATSEKIWQGSGAQHALDSTSFVSIDYGSGSSHAGDFVTERPRSASSILSNSDRILRQLVGSFRRHSTSGPLSISRNKSAWNRDRSAKCGSMSEHSLARNYRGSDTDFYELFP
eukprot:c18504_g1_i3 orf=637-4683(-)